MPRQPWQAGPPRLDDRMLVVAAKGEEAIY